MILTISKQTGQYVVDDNSLPGSPAVGRGHTMLTALGDWLIHHQSDLGIAFELTPEAQPAEDARRRRAMASR